jgi:heat-inducible transcriptional repressor
MLDQTSGLLADLTDCAAMVVSPGHDGAAIRSVQLVPLATQLALLVVVLADGSVHKHSVELPAEVDEARVADASSRLAAATLGAPLEQVPATAPASGDPLTDQVLDVALVALGSLAAPEAGEQLFVGGSSRMARAFDAVDTVRSVLSILEQQLVVVTLLRDLLDTGLSVAIGSEEHGLEPLASCAIVVMPVSVDGGTRRGTIGLLGPTRMNYPLALAAARVVGDRLGERMSEVSR